MDKKNNILDWIRKILIIILLVIFLVSSYKFVRKYYQYRQGIKTMETATALAGLREKSTEKTKTDIFNVDLDSLKDLDLSKLKEKNSDIIGWMIIPDTNVNYPILQTNNNDYYLTFTWEKKYNWMGSIFMDSYDNKDFSDFHTIIYGHNVRNELMFSQLLKYVNEDFFKSHPMIYISDGENIMKYEIFAAFEADVFGHVFLESIEGKDAKQSFINNSLRQSVVNTYVMPNTEDHIITLSTCTGRGHETRWVVQAVRLKD